MKRAVAALCLLLIPHLALAQTTTATSSAPLSPTMRRLYDDALECGRQLVTARETRDKGTAALARCVASRTDAQDRLVDSITSGAKALIERDRALKEAEDARGWVWIALLVGAVIGTAGGIYVGLSIGKVLP